MEDESRESDLHAEFVHTIEGPAVLDRGPRTGQDHEPERYHYRGESDTNRGPSGEEHPEV